MCQRWYFNLRLDVAGTFGKLFALAMLFGHSLGFSCFSTEAHFVKMANCVLGIYVQVVREKHLLLGCLEFCYFS